VRQTRITQKLGATRRSGSEDERQRRWHSQNKAD
jgi:hypothetical protein